MECNKEEAIRARDIAEKKLAGQDYVGAKKFAQKAQQLFPGLESLPQIVAVADVHMVAAKKLGTDTDWYGVLQVGTTADEGLIKKQYRRLALLLHPDKNKFAGAEAAFKLVGEASQVLSDTNKRSLHDHRRVGAPPSARQQGTNRQPSTTTTTTTTTTSNGRARKPAVSETAAFWTMCPSCLMRYQYLRTFENHNLLCPSCRMPFIAKDINAKEARGAGASPNFAWSPYSGGPPFQQDSKMPVPPSHPAPAPAPPPAPPPPASEETKKSNGKEEKEAAVPRTREQRKVKEDEHEEEKEVRRRERELRKKAEAEERARVAMERLLQRKKEQADKGASKERKRRLKRQKASESSDETDGSDDETLEDFEEDVYISARQSGESLRRSSRSRRNVSYRIADSDEEIEELTPKKAKITIPEKNQLNMPPNLEPGKRVLLNLAKDILQKNLKSEPVAATKIDPKDGNTNDVEQRNEAVPTSNHRDQFNTEKANVGVQKEAIPTSNHSDQSDTEEDTTEEIGGEEGGGEEGEDDEELETFTVPDPDFHNFDSTREAKDIIAGQIWALYDNDDGMPRFYAKIKESATLDDPFEVAITWLDLKSPSTEQKEIIDLGYVFTCGEFRHAKSQILDNLNTFSHSMKWEKGSKGTIKIYPRKGDVWGLYRNWKPGHGIVGLDDGDFHIYDTVEVVSSYEEDVGVRVKSLVKVKGFTSVFEHARGLSWIVPPRDLARFSHQVPAYRLKGNEGPGAPQGCWELDTASLSASELI